MTSAQSSPHFFSTAAIVVVGREQQREVTAITIDDEQQAVDREEIAPEEDVLVSAHVAWLRPELRACVRLGHEQGVRANTDEDVLEDEASIHDEIGCWMME